MVPLDCACPCSRTPPRSSSTSGSPATCRVSNPVDNGGHPVGDWRGRKILDTLVADPDVAALICPITGAFPPMSDNLAKDLVEVAETTDKPVCVIWGSPVGTELAYREILLSSSKVAVFRTFGNCVTAVKAWLDYHRFRQDHVSPFKLVAKKASPVAAEASKILGGGRPLSEYDSKQLIAAYGIPTTKEELCTTAGAAVRAARGLGYPVVMKACGHQLLHKSELGLVRIGVEGDGAARRTFAELTRLAENALDDPRGFDGILVSEMVSGGVEAVVGLSQDELFGPTVMVGLGGVLIEVLGDVAFAVPPFDRSEAARMVASLRGAAILDGVRGQPAADVDALIDVIMKVQTLALDLSGSIAELDINPIVVRPRGQGVVALDALIVGR